MDHRLSFSGEVNLSVQKQMRTNNASAKLVKAQKSKMNGKWCNTEN